MSQSKALFHFLNRYKINPNNVLSYFLLHAVPLDCKKKAFFLGLCKHFYSTSVTLGTTVLDLKKDGDAVFFCDDIYLSSFRGHKIGLDDIVVVSLEVLNGEKFCLVARFASRISHIIPHLLYSYLESLFQNLLLDYSTR